MNPFIQFKKTLMLPVFIALAVVTLVPPRVARADAVTDWNLIASNAIVVTAGQPPPVSVLHFAMVQGAVYDAVNAIDRGHEPYPCTASIKSDGFKGGRHGRGGLPCTCRLSGSPRPVPGTTADAAAAV